VVQTWVGVIYLHESCKKGDGEGKRGESEISFGRGRKEEEEKKRGDEYHNTLPLIDSFSGHSQTSFEIFQSILVHVYVSLGNLNKKNKKYIKKGEREGERESRYNTNLLAIVDFPDPGNPTKTTTSGSLLEIASSPPSTSSPVTVKNILNSYKQKKIKESSSLVTENNKNILFILSINKDRISTNIKNMPIYYKFYFAFHNARFVRVMFFRLAYFTSFGQNKQYPSHKKDIQKSNKENILAMTFSKLMDSQSNLAGFCLRKNSSGVSNFTPTLCANFLVVSGK
jgi:hypothetical protein